MDSIHPTWRRTRGRLSPDTSEDRARPVRKYQGGVEEGRGVGLDAATMLTRVPRAEWTTKQTDFPVKNRASLHEKSAVVIVDNEIRLQVFLLYFSDKYSYCL